MLDMQFLTWHKVFYSVMWMQILVFFEMSQSMQDIYKWMGYDLVLQETVVFWWWLEIK